MNMARWEIWVRETWLSELILEHSGIWPALEILHYVGLSLLVGTVGLFDLRVLGLARNIAPAVLHRLIPWGIFGFVVNLLTGLAFFSGFPEQYAYNPAFHFKLAFLALAMLNAAIFYTAAFGKVRAMQGGEDAALQAKVITAISLGSWIAVLICGRLLTFYRPPFFH